MAGIEKICELTGEYPSYDMYRFKRNQLQIMPSARPLFRGAGDTLYAQKDRLFWHCKDDMLRAYDTESMHHYEPPFSSVAEWEQYKKHVEKLRLVQHYEYAFVTRDPDLQGRVKGVYINWTSDISAVKRRMKRLLRCKKLNIVYVDNLSQTIQGL